MDSQQFLFVNCCESTLSPCGSAHAGVSGRYLFLGAGNPGGPTTESRRDYNTEHNRAQAIAVRLREMGILRFKED